MNTVAPIYHERSVIHGRAIVPFSTAHRAWALPGGLFTAQRLIAEQWAHAIDRAMRTAVPPAPPPAQPFAGFLMDILRSPPI